MAFDHYGPAHPAYSTLLANAALVYEDQGEYAKAVEILQTAETALVKSYGIISLNNLELNLADTNEQLATISTNIGIDTYIIQYSFSGLFDSIVKFFFFLFFHSKSSNLFYI